MTLKVETSIRLNPNLYHKLHQFEKRVRRAKNSLRASGIVRKLGAEIFTWDHLPFFPHATTLIPRCPRQTCEFDPLSAFYSRFFSSVKTIFWLIWNTWQDQPTRYEGCHNKYRDEVPARDREEFNTLVGVGLALVYARNNVLRRQHNRHR